MADKVDAIENLKVLSLDGGGSKGVYTLGVLMEIEAIAPKPLHEEFGVIYGTSTGSIIASLLCSGMSISQIKDEYFKLIPKVMGSSSANGRTSALVDASKELYQGKTFENCETRLGIVAVRTDFCRPMVFKSSADLALGRRNTFIPGFGVSLQDAVIASCSAYPFFEKRVVKTCHDGNVPVIDGGFVANDPTLLAIDSSRQLVRENSMTVLSIGTGDFPIPKPSAWAKLKSKAISSVFDLELTETIMRSNANTFELFRKSLFKDIDCIRINGKYNAPELATTFLESDHDKLQEMFKRGRNSVGENQNEQEVKQKFGW